MQDFHSSQRGAAIFLIAFTFLMLAGVTGAAIDYGRGLLLKSELRSALDAAALAGGTVVNAADRDQIIQKYFDVNFPDGYMGSTTSDLDIDVDAANSTLTVSASSNLDYSLFSVVHDGEINTTASTEVTLETGGMEVALVMDNTGSMYGTPMTSMKAAATELVDILFGDNATAENLYVSVVPFATQVNIGTAQTAFLTDLTQSNYSPTTWKGCVFARATSAANDHELTEEDTATGGGWTPFLWPAQSNYETNCWKKTSSGSPNCTLESSSPSGCSYEYKHSSGSYPRYYVNEKQCTITSSSSYYYGPNRDCTPPIIPLTNVKDTVQDGIDAMEAWSMNGTIIDTGLAWGWRTISPNFRGEWVNAVDPDLPLDYEDQTMAKVVILLTDGDQNFPSSKKYGAYRRIQDNILGTTDESDAEDLLDDRLAALCTTMKNKGIIIYTIGFTTSISGASQQMLKTCATTNAHYFYTPDTDDIDEVFQQIGDSLNNLRISH